MTRIRYSEEPEWEAAYWKAARGYYCDVACRPAGVKARGFSAISYTGALQGALVQLAWLFYRNPGTQVDIVRDLLRQIPTGENS